MLYTFIDFSFNGFNALNLHFVDVAAILSGILVIITKNPILSVLFLICLFGSISGHLMLSGLNFIGLSYLLVYIGAVSILFLFILMLINVRISELLTDSINSIPLAILICIFFVFFVDAAFPFKGTLFSMFCKALFVSSPSWDGKIAETSHITSIGNILYGNYAMWLILTTIILLLAMVGCIVITLKDKTNNTGVTSNEIIPHSFSLPLQSKVSLPILKKIKQILTYLFSMNYIKHVYSKVFTKRYLCAIIGSIIIGNIVRLFFIKYGVGVSNILLHDPLLFSFATGTSSFLSGITKITILSLFDLNSKILK